MNVVTVYSDNMYSCVRLLSTFFSNFDDEYFSLRVQLLLNVLCDLTHSGKKHSLQ